MTTVPILLITFNRPDYTQKVLESVRHYKPEQLFIFQDGVRIGNSDDIKRCALVREVIEKMVDWPCLIKKNYSSKNLGCGPGPASALEWYFEHVEEGIILEDDAVPHPDFFEYAAQLLKRYRENNDVRAIGSMNVDTQQWGDGSYYFSMMNRNLCAWASWRRAWKDFDIRLFNISKFKLRRVLRQYGCDIIEREYWCDRLDEIHRDGVGGSSWDMQFFMSIWLNHGKGIIPNVNLTSNVGTVSDATHQLSHGNIIDNIPSKAILPLTHPSTELIQKEADRQFHYRYFQPERRKWNWRKKAHAILNKRIKKLLNHQGPWGKRK